MDDLFENYSSPDIEEAKKHRGLFRGITYVSRASALLIEFNMAYETLIGILNAGISITETPSGNPKLVYDFTNSWSNFQYATLLLYIGLGFYYFSKYTEEIYKEKTALLNILIGKKEEKRLEHFLGK